MIIESDVIEVTELGQGELPMEMPAAEDYTGEDITDFRSTLDPANLEPILAAMRQSTIVAIDTETTGLDYMRATLHGVSIATADQQWYICGPALPYLLPELAELSQDPEKLWVGHNLKFDLHFLTPHGFYPKKMADTMLAQWLVDENMELALKSLAHTRLGYPADLPEFNDLLLEAKKRLKKKRKADVTIYDIPVHKLGEYAARDTRLTYDLWMLLVYDLEKEGQTEIFWEQEMPFIWVLLDMENAGFWIDQGAVKDLEMELRQEIAKDTAIWNDVTGGVNYASTKQLAEYLFETRGFKVQDRTEKGAPKVDEMTLQRLEPLDETGAIKALRDLKKAEKLIGTYIEPFQQMLYEGRLHGNFNQTGTVTGRLSSSNPNLQNVPSRSELGHKIRKTFAVPPGKVMIVCDYSQIELRMLAHESKEENFLKVFREKGDPHQMTADLAHVERHVGKTINFSWAYGAGPRKLCDTIEKDGNPRPQQADAKQWLNNFNSAYPTLVKWKNSVVKRARQLGYVPTIAGRKRRLPDLNNLRDEPARMAAERQCVNARIQGSCGDMMKWAMLQLHPWCKMYDALMLGQVHDELVFEIDEDKADEFLPIVQQVMESIYEHYNLTVPIIAEPGKGANWYEAK